MSDSDTSDDEINDTGNGEIDEILNKGDDVRENPGKKIDLRSVISSDDEINEIEYENGNPVPEDSTNTTVNIPDNSVIVLDGPNDFVIYTKMDYCSKVVSDWGFDQEIVQSLKDKLVDIDSLKYMTIADVDLLIPVEKLGIRIKFKQRLIEWRLVNVSIFNFFQ